MASYRTSNLGAVNAATQQIECSQLEAYLNAICSLKIELAGAFQRASALADRLMGCEPTPLQGDSNSAQTPNDPLLARLDHAISHAGELVSSILNQLNRLERL